MRGICIRFESQTSSNLLYSVLHTNMLACWTESQECTAVGSVAEIDITTLLLALYNNVENRAAAGDTSMTD